MKLSKPVKITIGIFLISSVYLGASFFLSSKKQNNIIQAIEQRVIYGKKEVSPVLKGFALCRKTAYRSVTISNPFSKLSRVEIISCPLQDEILNEKHSL